MASSESRCSSSIDAAGVRQDRAPDRRRCGTARPDRRSAGSRCPSCELPPLGPFCAGAEDDERRQILRFAAEAIVTQDAHARPAELLLAGVHQELARRVIEGVRDHRLDDGDVVDDLGQVRQQVRRVPRRFGRLSANLKFGPSSLEFGLMNAAR